MPPSEPTTIADRLHGRARQPIRTGMSGAVVERWTAPGAPDLYLKAAPPTWDRGLDAEAARLAWLATTSVSDRVPRVVAFELADQTARVGVDRLLTSAVPGADGATLAESCRDDGEGTALAERFGRALRDLHDALDPTTCPFDGRLDARLAATAKRVADGGVDPADFEPRYADRTPADLLDELVRTRPPSEDLVVCHGDWCYPNVLFPPPFCEQEPASGTGGRSQNAECRWWWGMVDLAGLGVACRWYDLGIGARSTSHNLGDAAVAPFLAGYGVEPDDERLLYYLLVDELQ